MTIIYSKLVMWSQKWEEVQGRAGGGVILGKVKLKVKGHSTAPLLLIRLIVVDAKFAIICIFFTRLVFH